MHANETPSKLTGPDRSYYMKIVLGCAFTRSARVTGAADGLHPRLPRSADRSTQVRSNGVGEVVVVGVPVLPPARQLPVIAAAQSTSVDPADHALREPPPYACLYPRGADGALSRGTATGAV